jgi:signal transduction histidine kinase/CheY-like chemotaxis protein/HPt (histidine-containing phosphotransfer) domain-containing protein
MSNKSKKSKEEMLISIELEMEKAARFSAEMTVIEQQKEIVHLKDILQKGMNKTPEHSGVEMLDLILDHLQTGILIENETGLVITINKTFCEIFNITIPQSSIIGTDLFSNNSIDTSVLSNIYYFNQRTNEILSNRTEVRNDLIEFKDGTTIERDFIPIFEGEKYQGHIWYYTNATLKNNLQIRLDKQKHVYEKILSLLPTDIAVLNTEFADLFLNPIAIKDNELRKWIIEWLIGKKSAPAKKIELYTNEVTSYHELFKEVISNKYSGHIEEMKITDDGIKKYFLRQLNPIIDENGEIEMIIGYNTDITERVLAENELKKAKEITEELGKAKDLFLANVSHEIRTPMNGILGVVNLLSKTALTQHQQKMTSMINDAATNLLVIVNDILNLEKINSGKLDIEEISFILNDKVSFIVESFQQKAKDKKLDLSFKNEITPTLHVIGDPFRLGQILNNLIGNALKFTEIGGIEITVSIITESSNQIWIRFAVKDTGIGIDKSKIDQLFEPYKQAEQSTSRKYGGTGLGLSISKNLIELLGGRIAVESTPNKGSLFSFNIPFKKNNSKVEDLIVPPDYAKLNGCRVLLAEDVEMNQFIARAILEEKGMYVTIASDGKEVIEKVSNYQFDLILMDISMPYIDGIQATSIIRSLPNTDKKNIPIIALTANALRGDEKKYIEAGMNGYISKPFLKEQFLNAILSALTVSTFVIQDTPFKDQGAETEKLYNEKQIMGTSSNKPEFVEKMIELFLKTMPSDMEKLEMSAQKNDWKMVERTAHRMKSAIRGMGITVAVKQVKQVEEMAQNIPIDMNIIPLINDLNNILQSVLNQIQADYPNFKVSK